MTIVLLLAAAMLAAAPLLLVARMTIGPTILDRSLALDVLMAVTICGTAVHTAHRGVTTTLPVLLVLAAVGFVGAVSIARYAVHSEDVDPEADDASADTPSGGTDRPGGGIR